MTDKVEKEEKIEEYDQILELFGEKVEEIDFEDVKSVYIRNSVFTDNAKKVAVETEELKNKSRVFHQRLKSTIESQLAIVESSDCEDILRPTATYLQTSDEAFKEVVGEVLGEPVYSQPEEEPIDMTRQFTPEEMADKEIVKCMFIDEPEILDAAIEKIPAEFYERYSINKSAPFYLELLKKNVDKGSAITHLAEKLGLTKDETMAIGDEENDRAMLEVVGNPVVMENGNPELKKIAKYITKTNDESGVAHAIRTWVL